MKKKISVLVVDDSRLMRKILSDLFNADPRISVIGTANDGMEAIQKVHQLKPDVITLDLKMPDYDGQYALEQIMLERPTPVIMVSSYTQSGREDTLKALNAGAFDFFAKDKGSLSSQVQAKHNELIAKVKVASRVDVKTLVPTLPRKPVLPKPPPTLPGKPVLQKLPPTKWDPAPRIFNVVVIGASTGGPQAIEQIITSINSDFPAAILVAQHMPKLFTQSFAERLHKISRLRVREAVEGDVVNPGNVYVCPGNKSMVIRNLSDSDLVFDGDVIISLIEKELPGDMRPSINILMHSVAENFGVNAVGILLSGMGTDGAIGLKAILLSGGLTIAQDESTSVVYGMPKAAVENHAVTKVLPVSQIAGFLNYMVQREAEIQ